MPESTEPSMPQTDPNAAEHMHERLIEAAKRDAEMAALFYTQVRSAAPQLGDQGAAMITAAWMRSRLY